MNYLILYSSLKELALEGLLQDAVDQLPKTGLMQASIGRRLEYQLSPELTSRIGPISSGTALSKVLHEMEVQQLSCIERKPGEPSACQMMAEIEKSWETFGGPLELRSKLQGTPVTVPRSLLLADFLGNYDYLLPFTSRAAARCLGRCHRS